MRNGDIVVVHKAKGAFTEWLELDEEPGRARHVQEQTTHGSSAIRGPFRALKRVKVDKDCHLVQSASRRPKLDSGPTQDRSLCLRDIVTARL
ncbi:uncharacterized protein L969DRAFT_42519 [Mixia osmundae IAM 14324]|uniref:Uncharacterized protein n=1 Tax=Mixia osmundae (strain CBS 9802 / IAM 14324 / JCM 22182 / KY 12970) TaxID=764103 RepID=G7DTE5_MIXOS|nr:uncharacterized protein L969DRAFT_42519 [Mixia osmundae IAM 14324]KEI42870.1 hypothetical protein L969DRAFT_42519 [Mixia osmundae IAM 14324]GAA93792.1 hypothetical protein E5Q_00438 [Mixia osmundae IAM 14324]